MKKIFTTIFVLTAFLFTISAQEPCGNIVELSGTGMQDENGPFVSKTLSFTNVSTIDSIVVEAIYKSPVENPSGNLQFMSVHETLNVSGVALPSYTAPGYNGHPHVFRTTMIPASSITIYNNIDNPEGLWSFAAYVYRQTSEEKYSMVQGEHGYYYINSINNPSMQTFTIPAADDPRDITINMGITELNNDTRVGYFVFVAGTYKDSIEVVSYDPALDISYIIEEITLPDVPGNVTEIEMYGYSPKVWTPSINMYNGDSYIGGRAVVTIDCPPEEEEATPLCTYTQGFYGNSGGKTCWGMTTTELLMELLDTDLVVGGGTNTLTITQDDIECLYTRLPGGGPSAVLDGAATCEDPVGIKVHKKGSFQNSLLAQTITLALNFRLSPALYDVEISSTMTTLDIENCLDPEAEGIEGTEQEFYFSSDIMDYLGEGATLGDILDLANMALAGEDISPLSLSEVSDAATTINEAFDECRVLMTAVESNGTAPEGSELRQAEKDNQSYVNQGVSFENVSGIAENEDAFTLGTRIYPNPVNSNSVLELTVNKEDKAYVAIYDVRGKELFVLYNNTLNPKTVYSIPIPVSELENGLYYMKVVTGNSSDTKAFSVTR